MIKHVLMDLDGTLLHFDHKLFVQTYIRLLSQKLAAYMPPPELSNHLIKATEKMLTESDGRRTNAEIFWQYFTERARLDKARLEPLIDEFYEQEFQSLQAMTSAAPIRPVIDAILARAVPITIATNPVFPAVAVRSRLRWAGLDWAPFALITTYEFSHYCKPRPEYFQEILTALNADAAECLMIGNDVGDDLPAARVGIKTYLVTDHLINRHNAAITADYTGSCSDLARDIVRLLAV